MEHGKHKMPGGHMMSDKAMKAKMKGKARGGKKKGKGKRGY